MTRKPTAPSSDKPSLAILCPVYNEEEVVSLFWGRIAPVIETLSDRYRLNLVFLDNASTDGTYAQISQIRDANDNVYVMRLSNNVGYQKSLQAGLMNVESDIYAFIDVDCEDPPEMILDFAKEYEAGFDIVYGVRKGRPESELIKFFRRAFYRIVKTLADEDSILLMAEFSLFDREVRNAIIDEANSFPFIRSNIARVGFRRKGIDYTRHKRIAGQTRYNFMGMVIFAVAGILSTTTLPLRLPIYVFPLWILLLGAFGAAGITTENPWWFLAAFLLFAFYTGFALAFIAIYLARSYKNSLGRPNAFIVSGLSFLPPSKEH